MRAAALVLMTIWACPFVGCTPSATPGDELAMATPAQPVGVSSVSTQGALRIEGRVQDAEGRPMGSAHVALVPPGSNAALRHVVSDDDGSFSFDAAPGSYALTATVPGRGAAYSGMFEVGHDRPPPPRLVVSSEGIHLSGRVVDHDGAAIASTLVRFIRISDDQGDIFYTRTDAEGRYRVGLLQAASYRVSVADEAVVSRSKPVDGSADAVVDLVATRLGPAPGEVVAWMKGASVPLERAEPGGDDADLQSLKNAFASVRVVGLGESTHGTREFFQIKHRLFQLMVEELGYRAFALEANFGACIAIDRYVRGEPGDPAALLGALGVWPWVTEEVAALLDWVRDYNATHDDKVRFYGMDMQNAALGAKELLGYLDKVDPTYGASVREGLSPLEGYITEEYAGWDQGKRDALDATLTAVGARLDARRAGYVPRSSAHEWAVARRNVVAAQQTVRLAAATDLFEELNVRDESMAANVAWMVEQGPKGSKVAVWAHDGHVARGGGYDFTTMGGHLGQRYGSAYLAIGFPFGEGEFQAMEVSSDKDGNQRYLLRGYRVGRPSENDLAAGLARVERPLFFLDLREPNDATRDWLRRPMPVRSVGATFPGEAHMSDLGVVAQRWDALVYVDRTTRARPIGRWLKSSDMSPAAPPPPSR